MNCPYNNWVEAIAIMNKVYPLAQVDKILVHITEQG